MEIDKREDRRYNGVAMKTRIIYIEYKGDNGISGPARIGRVTYSKSGKSIYYKGKRLKL